MQARWPSLPHRAHRDGTFDRKRPITPIGHYRSDENNDVGEEDDTHFDEVIQCHDLRRDPGVRSTQELIRRVADNRTVRGVHHHVFDLRSAVLLVSEAGWTPTSVEARRPYDILVLAQNSTTPPTGCDLRSISKGSPFRLIGDRFWPTAMFPAAPPASSRQETPLMPKGGSSLSARNYSVDSTTAAQLVLDVSCHQDGLKSAYCRHP